MNSIITVLESRDVDLILAGIVQRTTELVEVSPAVQKLLREVFEAGARSREFEVEELRNERDHWYERFANPGRQFTDMRQRRLAQAAESYYEKFVAAHGVGMDLLSEVEHYVDFLSAARQSPPPMLPSGHPERG